MKRVLITGENSYIGMSVEKWLSQWPDEFTVDTISVRDDSWKEFDFSSYDSVFHVAGIAHNSSDPKLESLYYRVNTDLTIEVAKKAKLDGVKQFIFMSSIIVYGEGEKGRLVITKDTKPNPKNFYGDSKLKAEVGLQNLADDSFQLTIIRPPMIYGKGSKGNYPKLVKLARTIPFFPDYPNNRSMLHIDNLSELLRHIISAEKQGLFYPQNTEYVKTSNLVLKIATVHKKRMVLFGIFNPGIRVMLGRVDIINRVFGDCVYEYSMSQIEYDYCVNNFEKSIEITEGV